MNRLEEIKKQRMALVDMIDDDNIMAIGIALSNLDGERENILLQTIKELEQDYAELECKFECVLDNATGGRASKSNIDLEIAYKLISDNVDFWVDSATKELEEALQNCIEDNAGEDI